MAVYSWKKNCGIISHLVSYLLIQITPLCGMIQYHGLWCYNPENISKGDSIVFNLISVFFEESNIWFYVDGKAWDTRKIYKSMPCRKNEVTKRSQRNLICKNSILKYGKKQWWNNIRKGIRGMCFNIWEWFRRRIKGWILLISGVYLSSLVVLKVWNSMPLKNRWMSSLKSQILNP